MTFSLNQFDQFHEDAFTVPYAWKKKGRFPGPTVTVLGGVHGNEAAGVQIVHELLQQKVHAGILQLALGNISAITEGKRFTEKDLNRSFGHPVAGVQESVRANLLKALLTQTDVLFDVHSTLKPSHPFLAIPDAKNLKNPLMNVVAELGIPTVVTGKGLLPPNGEPIYADTFVEACGGFAVTIEAGWTEDPKTLQIKNGLYKALAALGILDLPKGFQGEQSESEIRQVEILQNSRPLEIWDAYWNVLAEPGFSFAQDWKNFEQLASGTVFASTENGPLTVPQDSIILFPKPKPITGEEVCVIAKKVVL